jgi:exodeoxyribonuclease-3
VAAHAEGRWNGGRAEPGGPDDAPGPEGQRLDGTVEPGDRRHRVRVWSVYVPNGREPDHDHYAYKLAWFDALAATVGAEQAAPTAAGLIGDFNVPDRRRRLRHHRVGYARHGSRARGARRPSAAGLEEVVPRPLKYDVAFTFWDYRQLAFPKNNGMRIDLVYGSPAFAAAVTDAYVDREARKGKGTSDHAPVVVDPPL